MHLFAFLRLGVNVKVEGLVAVWRGWMVHVPGLRKYMVRGRDVAVVMDGSECLSKKCVYKVARMKSR